MITPELISFIKSELAKGKLQEQIRSELATGGWNTSDLEEAFSFILKIPVQPIQPIQTVKPVQPIQPITQPITPITPIAQPIQPLQPTPTIQPIQTGFVSANTPVLAKSKSHSKILLFFIIFFVIFGSAFAIWYFFKPDIMKILGGNNNVSEAVIVPDQIPENVISDTSVDDNLNTAVEQEIIIPDNNVMSDSVVVKDCGVSLTTSSDDFSMSSNKKTFENDPVMVCLGNSALKCELAKGTLKNESIDAGRMFPSPKNIEIIKKGSSCNFKISYPASVIAIDKWTSKNLAGQSIECPVSIIKELDEEKSINDFVFKTPDKNLPGLYTRSAYYYISELLFFTTKGDETKIKSFGCTGDLIKSRLEREGKIVNKLVYERVIRLVQEINPEAYFFQEEKGTYKDFCLSSKVLTIKSNLTKEANVSNSICKDSPETYVFSAPLNNGKFYCVDSKDFSGEIGNQIIGLSCL